MSALLLCQPARGFQIGNLRGNQKQLNNDLDNIGHSESSTSVKGSYEHSNPSDDGINNSTPEYRSDGNSEISIIAGNASETDQSIANSSQLLENSTYGIQSESVTNDSRSAKVEISTEFLNNVSNSNNESSGITSGSIQTGKKSTSFIMTPSSETNGSLSSSSIETNDEQEGVVIGKPFHTENGNTTAASDIKTLFQRATELISDTYTLSILLPVAAGVVFASTIIVTIATCRCLRRRCRRRQLRRKALPDSVKNLRPSDRARLLAESSDEEF